MSKHTPGPWEWIGNASIDGPDGITQPVLESSVRCGQWCQGGTAQLEMSDADRALIAAAPELLEALRDMRETLRLLERRAPGYDWNADPDRLTLATGKAYSIADAAIAKAEGRND